MSLMSLITLEGISYLEYFKRILITSSLVSPAAAAFQSERSESL